MCTFGYIRVFHIDDFGRMLIGCIFHFFVLQSSSCVRSTTDLLRSSGKIPFTGCPLYFDTLNSWHSDILLTFWTQNSWLMGQKISHKELYIMDPVDHVFLKHATVTIFTFSEWLNLKKLWFIIQMVSIKRIFCWNPFYM